MGREKRKKRGRKAGQKRKKSGIKRARNEDEKIGKRGRRRARQRAGDMSGMAAGRSYSYSRKLFFSQHDTDTEIFSHVDRGGNIIRSPAIFFIAIFLIAIFRLFRQE
jgi:hypothetical protein